MDELLKFGEETINRLNWLLRLIVITSVSAQGKTMTQCLCGGSQSVNDCTYMHIQSYFCVSVTFSLPALSFLSSFIMQSEPVGTVWEIVQ